MTEFIGGDQNKYRTMFLNFHVKFVVEKPPNRLLAMI